jgi:hypothetical protein
MIALDDTSMQSRVDHAAHDYLGMIFCLPEHEPSLSLERVLMSAKTLAGGRGAPTGGLMRALVLEALPFLSGGDATAPLPQHYAVWGERLVRAARPNVQQLLPAAEVSLTVLEVWRTQLLDHGVRPLEPWLPALTAVTLAALSAHHAHYTYGVSLETDVTYSVRATPLDPHTALVNREDYEVRVALQTPSRIVLLYDCDGLGQVTFHLDAHGRRAEWNDRPNVLERHAHSPEPHNEASLD